MCVCVWSIRIACVAAEDSERQMKAVTFVVGHCHGN